MSTVDGVEHPLRTVIDRYNDAWNRHDVDAIVALHAPEMVFANHTAGEQVAGEAVRGHISRIFENHTAGERAEGDEVRGHIARIFESWPDLAFATRRLYVRDDLVVQEWTASATHARELRRGDLVAPASGRRLEWKGMDVIPFADGLVRRKDVYSDSLSILRQAGLIDVPTAVAD